MKVYIGKYVNWIGPYQIMDAIFFWHEKYPKDKLAQRWDYRLHDRLGDWLASTWVNRFCNWVHSKQKRIEYVKLDKLQEEFGHGEGKEFELVKLVLSPDFEKYDTPSILDFGGGHVYNDGVKELLQDYPNVILLMPSTDTQKTKEFLIHCLLVH
mgnify:CR=1 FL=1